MPTPPIPSANPAIVPTEGPAPAPQSSAPFGLNNENLPERLQEALRRLVLQFSTESESSRRQEIRRIKQAHQFWRGLQYLWWSERDQNWHLPTEQRVGGAASVEDMPRYEFVTNIYQAFGLSLVSVLSQDVPRVRFFPSSAQAEEDVAAAKAATEVAGAGVGGKRGGDLGFVGGVSALDGRESWRLRAVCGGWAAVWISSGDGNWRAGSKDWRGCLCLPGVQRGDGGKRLRE